MKDVFECLTKKKKKVLSIQIKCSFTQTLKRKLLYVKKKNPHEISEFASTLVLLFMNILRRYQNTSSQTKANMNDFFPFRRELCIYRTVAEKMI